MVFNTGLAALAEDVCAGLKRLRENYGEGEEGSLEVTLVGHSSGGGLAQWVTERTDEYGVKIKGLVLLAGTPCFGQ